MRSFLISLIILSVVLSVTGFVTAKTDAIKNELNSYLSGIDVSDPSGSVGSIINIKNAVEKYSVFLSAAVQTSDIDKIKESVSKMLAYAKNDSAPLLAAEYEALMIYLEDIEF